MFSVSLALPCFRGSESLPVFHSPTALNHSPCLAPYLKALQPTHVHHVIAALRNKTHHLHCFLFQKMKKDRIRERAMHGNWPQFLTKAYEQVQYYWFLAQTDTKRKETKYVGMVKESHNVPWWDYVFLVLKNKTCIIITVSELLIPPALQCPSQPLCSTWRNPAARHTAWALECSISISICTNGFLCVETN